MLFYNLKIGGLVLAAFACLTACANEPTDNCHETALTQIAMNVCARHDAKKAETELDDIYNKLMTKISPEDKSKLNAAKDAWVIYRQKQCEFNTLGTVGGSVHPLIISECYADLTVQQTKNLEEQLYCEEGNISCGGQ